MCVNFFLSHELGIKNLWKLVKRKNQIKKQFSIRISCEIKYVIESLFYRITAYYYEPLI